MIEPTASLSLVRDAGNLVLSGVSDGSAFGLISMNEPALTARISYADESPHVSGALPTQAVWQLALLNVVAHISADTAVALEARKQELREAIGRFSWTAVQTVNGVSRTWSCLMGSLAQDSGFYELEHLSGLVEVYSISIPVQPMEV